jgi:GxxExxY protein
MSHVLKNMNHRGTESTEENRQQAVAQLAKSVEDGGTEILNELSSAIIGGAIEVHREFGPGLLESIYEEALVLELVSRGLEVERQKEVRLNYKGQPLNSTYRIDLLVEHQIIIELKAVSQVLSIHEAQLLTYLKITQCRLGLLLNFNVPVLKQGIKRVING